MPDSSQPRGLQPSRLLRPWDFPGKSGLALPSPIAPSTCLYFLNHIFVSLLSDPVTLAKNYVGDNGRQLSRQPKHKSIKEDRRMYKICTDLGQRLVYNSSEGQRASLVAQTVKNLPAMLGDPGLIPGSGKIPWRREPSPVVLSGEFHGQRSLAGYSPRGHKESDTTEQLTLYLSPLHDMGAFQKEMKTERNRPVYFYARF